MHVFLSDLLLEVGDCVHHVDLDSLQLLHLALVLFEGEIIAGGRHEGRSVKGGRVSASGVRSKLTKLLDVSFNVGGHVNAGNGDAFREVCLFFLVCAFKVLGSGALLLL